MTVRERIRASRLIEKIDAQADYANKIGVSCRLVANEAKTNCGISVQELEPEKK